MSDHKCPTEFVCGDCFKKFDLVPKIKPREFWIPLIQDYTGIYGEFDESWMNPKDFIHVREIEPGPEPECKPCDGPCKETGLEKDEK